MNSIASAVEDDVELDRKRVEDDVKGVLRVVDDEQVEEVGHGHVDGLGVEVNVVHGQAQPAHLPGDGLQRRVVAQGPHALRVPRDEGHEVVHALRQGALVAAPLLLVARRLRQLALPTRLRVVA